ncbi:hypothetical protein SUGI_0894500 [Cryptomeria japonica]|nr:hypothetical protein SUGI_0894500 [Cryptomeria japonica]
MGWLTRILYWFPWTYVHVGIEFTLDSINSPVLRQTYNTVGFHNLEVYLHLVNGLQENNKMPFESLRRNPSLVNKNSDLLIRELQIPSYWWRWRNKEVKRIDGMLVYSSRSVTYVPLPRSSSSVISNSVIVLQLVLVLSSVIILFQIGSTK